MIRVLKATSAQYNNLNGLINGNSKIEFIKDAANNWIIGKSVLSDSALISIRPWLNQLQEIDFNPIVTE